MTPLGLRPDRLVMDQRAGRGHGPQRCRAEQSPQRGQRAVAAEAAAVATRYLAAAWKNGSRITASPADATLAIPGPGITEAPGR